MSVLSEYQEELWSVELPLNFLKRMTKITDKPLKVIWCLGLVEAGITMAGKKECLLL
jgi:hypothetical protein